MSDKDDKSQVPGTDEDMDDKTVFAPAAPQTKTDRDEDTTSSKETGPEEDERTVFASLPSGPADEGDDERTIFAGAPEDSAGDAEDRTILNLSSGSEEQVDDRTIVGQPLPDQDGPSGGASDRQMLSGLSAGTAEAGQGDDADRTVFAGVTGRPLQPDTTTHTGLPGQDNTLNTAMTQSYVPPSPGTPPAPLSSIGPGTLIGGQYRVDKQIDEGGMGRVYRGWDLNTDADVAIKVILPDRAEDKKVANMFRREAKTLRQLHHDAIVRFFNYIPPNDQLNLHALVMGYIEGRKLSDRLKQDGPLSEDEVIALTKRLAEGLHRAHELKIVHRDVSPDNIMLPGDDIRQAVLIDFGISRSEKIKDVTLGNEFAGKLKYVSPEQLGAYGNDAGGPSDVYSLALLMVTMLNGKPLPMGDTISDAVQMRQGVPDLSGVNPRFQDLLYQMLLPDPAQRMDSMEKVARALRALEGRETTFEPTKDNVVEGLQAVPMAATATSGQAKIDAQAAEIPKQKSKGLLLVMAAVLAIGGGGGGYLYSTGFFDLPEPEATPTPEDGMVRSAGSRSTFLAETLPEGCALAVRRSRGPQAGLIEGYATNPSLLNGVADRFGSTFGVTPDLVTREVPESHCPAVEMTRTLQGTAGARLEMSLDTHDIKPGGRVTGRLHGGDGRQNWIALIDSAGRIYSLMQYLEDSVGTERRFSFKINSSAAGEFMIISTASDAPLVRAGALKDGTDSEDFLPLLLRELAGDGQGSVDIAYLTLTP